MPKPYKPTPTPLPIPLLIPLPLPLPLPLTPTPTPNQVVVNLRVMPKPVTGCVRMSGVADQSGITWWTHYNFHLSRQQESPTPQT